MRVGGGAIELLVGDRVRERLERVDLVGRFRDVRGPTARSGAAITGSRPAGARWMLLMALLPLVGYF